MKRFGLIALVLIAIAGLGSFLINTWHTPGSIVDKSKQAAGFAPSRLKTNILVLGIDERRDDKGRSNVTCVVTVHHETQDVTLLWIPRDSRVKIPEHGWDKIGHAYNFDGSALTRRTVEEFVGIPMDFTVAINQGGFIKVIDALGGLDIDVEKRMHYYDPWDEGEEDTKGLIDLKPGLQHLDGNKALQYVRFRNDENGDLGRIERQQKFVRALLATMTSPAVIPKIPEIIRQLNYVVESDMPFAEMLFMAKLSGEAYKKGIKTAMVDGLAVYIDEVSYLMPDIIAMRRQVAEIQRIPIDDKYLEAAKRVDQEYDDSTGGLNVMLAP